MERVVRPVCKEQKQEERMSKNIDVTALGELLVDFTANGISVQGNPTYEANPGGAPCNVLAMLGKLGCQTAFIGKVGDDAFGQMLKKKAQEQGINLSGLMVDQEVHTTLAFVQKLDNGDRDFSFYRNPGADIRLTKAEVQEHSPLIENARLFHFGTLSMTDEIVEEATIEALRIAKESGCLISFDPNLRPPLWRSRIYAEEKIRYGLSKCDILKISDNEVEFLTGRDGTNMEEMKAGAQELIEQYQIPLVFVTLGPNGSLAFKDGTCEYQPGFKINAVETTGAGDTFCACALYYVLKYGLAGLDAQRLSELLRFANAAASVITERKGALAVMPTVKEIQARLKA